MRVPIILSFVAMLVAAPAVAADQSPPPQQAQWQRPSPAEAEARRAEWKAKRSADIALLLGLRADQKPALDTYLAARHPHRDGHDGRGARHGANGAPGSDGTMASLDRMSQRIDAHEAEAKQRIEATKHFYAGLTRDQQQRFDALEHLSHEHGHGGHGRGGHGGGHDMHAMG